MNWTKLSVATTLAAALIASPTTAHADCGEPDQPPCTGPVPTVDQVMGLLGELTDPNIPGANKTDIVTPAFDDRHARGLDSILNYCRTFGMLPPPFNVTDIQPAPNNMAGATVSVPRTWHYRAGAWPVVLVNQGGRWMLTSDTAYDTARQVERNQAHSAGL
jgi:hypothetical protein